ncbi:Cytochrome P450 monooxygenase [Exophiala dermatitidis]
MFASFGYLSPFLAMALILYCLLSPIIVYLRDPLHLRRFPAPSLLAAITPLWLIHVTWLQNRSRTIHREINRLGTEVIRVAPNHIIFNNPAPIKDIYGVLAISRGVAKDEFYDRLARDAHDLVQFRDRGEHSDRRKAIANAFAAKTVVEMESVIRDKALQLVKKMDDLVNKANTSGRKEALNLRLWLNYFTLDVIGDTAFSDPMGFLERRSDATDAESQAATSYRISSTIDTLHRGWTLKTFCVRKLRRRLRNGALSRPSGDFMNFVLADRISSAGKEEDEDKTAASDSEFRSLVADSVMMMNAGSDTTAAALTSTILFLLQNPKALARLREEVSPFAPPGEGGVFAYDDVKDLPSTSPVSIAGHSVLPGTVVAVAPYSIHKHPSLYRDPDAYVPERWIEADSEFPNQQQDLKQYNIVFSQGSRACIGRHLAIVELQILVPTLIARYNLQLGNLAADLEVKERFNSNPGPMPVIVERRSAPQSSPLARASV